MSFPSCLQRLWLQCPVALRGARGVMGAGSAQRVPLPRGGPATTASPPLGTPHSLRESPQDTAHAHTHTQAPHLGRSPGAPASPDVGDEGLDVPRQHGDHIGDDEGGRGPADEQSGDESHAGHAAQHRRRLPCPGHRQLGGSALESRPGSGDSRGAFALPHACLSPPAAALRLPQPRGCPAGRSLPFTFGSPLRSPPPTAAESQGQPWAPSPFTAAGT